jgi:glycosyltransferase involved in cell wall biosynthesis
MSSVERVDGARRLRIAVLGDFDGVHTRSWVRWFVARGHDVHAISFYPPSTAVEGVTVHTLRPARRRRGGGGAGANAIGTRGGSMRGLARLAHGVRYRRAGLRRVVREIAPDVFHGHFVVEHGFYGALAGVHPYVVTAWGSDVLVEPGRDPVSRWIARWTLRRADLATSNNAYMAECMASLGAPAAKVEVVVLGADAHFGERWDASVNVRGRASGELPVILSTRAHERLYNVGDIIDAYGIARGRGLTPRLVVAHSGSLTEDLRARAAAAGGEVLFTGTVDAARLRDLMADAEVFVSVPSSDGTSVALLQAMAAGCFPIVSDLATQREWVEDGANGLRVPAGSPEALADAISRALEDGELRRRAAQVNRRVVEERGTNETQMAKMEGLYLRLAGRA